MENETQNTIELILRSHFETVAYWTKVKNAALYASNQFREINLQIQIETAPSQTNILATVISTIAWAYLPTALINLALRPMLSRSLYIIEPFIDPIFQPGRLNKGNAAIFLQRLKKIGSNTYEKDLTRLSEVTERVIKNGKLVLAPTVGALLSTSSTKPQRFPYLITRTKKKEPAHPTIFDPDKAFDYPKPQDFTRPSVRLLELVNEEADQIMLASDWASRRTISLIRRNDLFDKKDIKKYKDGLYESFFPGKKNKKNNNKPPENPIKVPHIDFFSIRNTFEAILWAVTYDFRYQAPSITERYGAKPAQVIKEGISEPKLAQKKVDRVLSYLAGALFQSPTENLNFYEWAHRDLRRKGSEEEVTKRAKKKVVDHLSKLRADVNNKTEGVRKKLSSTAKAKLPKK